MSDETIKVYGEIQINKNYSENDVNDVIKKLYDTKFFSYICKFCKRVLVLMLKKSYNQSIIIEGEKANKFQKEILKFISLKKNHLILKASEKYIEIIKSFYKSLGLFSKS